MRSRHEADLRWLLDGSAEAALGAKSAHASFVARLEGSTGNSATDESDIQDRLCEAARRERRIRDNFERIPKRHQRALAAYFRPDKLAAYWGPLTHVLPLTKTYSRKEHGPIDGGLGLRMTLASATEAQKAAVTGLRREAEAIVAEARSAYETMAAARELGARRREVRP